jgi:ClpP class serine protease
MNLDPLNHFTADFNKAPKTAGQNPAMLGQHQYDESNAQAYQSVQRQRQLTLGDLLLENRIVFLQGEIHTGNANEVVMKLLYLQSENRRKVIHFYINSPGGSVVATLAIYHTRESCYTNPMVALADKSVILKSKRMRSCATVKSSMRSSHTIVAKKLKTSLQTPIVISS